MSLVLRHIDTVLLGDKIRLVSSNAAEHAQIAGFVSAEYYPGQLTGSPGSMHKPLVWLQSFQQPYLDANLVNQLRWALPTLTGMRQQGPVMQSSGLHFLILASVNRTCARAMDKDTIALCMPQRLWQEFTACGFNVKHVLVSSGFPGQSVIPGQPATCAWKCHVLLVLELPQPKKQAGKAEQHQAGMGVRLPEMLAPDRKQPPKRKVGSVADVAGTSKRSMQHRPRQADHAQHQEMKQPFPAG